MVEFINKCHLFLIAETNGVPAIALVFFGVAFLAIVVGAYVIPSYIHTGAPRLQPVLTPETVLREELSSLKVKFAEQNVATWDTLNDALRVDFLKQSRPTVLMLVADDSEGGLAAADCLANLISRLMQKVSC